MNTGLLARQLKKYDKFLKVSGLLDGTVKIYRESPFSNLTFGVLTIRNKYLGSNRWIIKQISLKDNQRKDIIGETINNNRKIRERDNSINMHEEVVDFIVRDKIVIS